jgi:serine O-acetyltransferase
MEKKLSDNKLNELVKEIVDTYKGDSGINFIDAKNLPVRSKIVEVLEQLIELIFPGYTGKRKVTEANVHYVVIDILCHVYTELSEQIERAYRYRCQMESCDTCDCSRMAEEATGFLLEKMPEIREMLKGDIKAAYDGDPAAKSYEEIVISYPYVIAITTQRIAHELFKKEVPLIPRIACE